MEVSAKNLILDKTQTERKLRRIAYEIYEHNFEEREIVLAGIDYMGYIMASRLQKELKEIAPFEVLLTKVSLDKLKDTQGNVEIDTPESNLQNRVVILIDDVLNTGKTLVYSLKPFLHIPLKKIQTAVLVNRSHHLFPIHADFEGYALSTTVREHVKVILDDEEMFGVYLH